jgi:PAS domain S-box-containing protein
MRHWKPSNVSKHYLLPAAIVCLFLLLWIKSQAIDPQIHQRYTSQLRQVQELDARLNQQVLQTRLGLITYYDPLDQHLAQIKQLQTQLQQIPAAVGGNRNSITQLIQTHIQSYQQKKQYIDRFKSQQAILRNSLAYFPIAITTLTQQPNLDITLTQDLDQLLQHTLLFNQTTTDTLKPLIEQDIQRIRTTVQAIVQADPQLANLQQSEIERAIAHAQMIVQQRPQVDRSLDLILNLPTRQNGEAIAQAYFQAYQQALDTANLYRLALYVLSTILVMAIAAAIIRQLRQSALALQRSESKYRSIFENSQVGIFRSRLTDGLMLDANPTLARMLGYDSPAEIVSMKYSPEFYVDPRQRQQVLKRIQTTGELYDFEAHLCRRDGSDIWVLFSARRSADSLEGVVVDISDRRQAQAALEQAKTAAEVANRAKSQFLSNMSHELRTPLNVILGFTQLLARQGSLNSQQQEYLQTIHRSGDHLLMLINDVLEMSKIEAGRIVLREQDLNLYHLLDEVQMMFRFKAEAKGLQLLVERSPDLPECIRTDGSKLRQILVNLISNAIKFTETGRIVLSASLDLGSDLDLNSALYPLSFTVEDTGAGIAAAELEHLFEPFVQLEAGIKSQEGTGLGLPISRKFVELMGGTLTATSQIGCGSCFRFTLLAKPTEADVIATRTTDRRVIGLVDGQPNYRILIVEDKPENRQLMLELLQSVGFEVASATNGREAIALCRRWLPHLIWMDLRMPIMDGYEATRQIKAMPAAPIVLALTGSALEEERAVAIAAGCDDFIRKPFREAEIFERMAHFLGVNYRYESIDSTTTLKHPELPSADISSTLLAVMPSDWREQLHQAATQVDGERVLALIQQVPPEHSELAIALTALVTHYRFDRLVALTSVQEDGSS